MNLATFLQAFLLLDIFLVGALATLAVQYWRAHRQTKKPVATTGSGTPAREYVPPMMRERLVKESEAKFQEALTTSAGQLQASLGMTASQLDQLLRQLGSEIVGNELERYRAELAQLRSQAQANMGAISAQIDAHRAELEAQMQQQLAGEKQRLVQQIDTKLADAVASFLLEILQHNIDLGAQEAYLREQLEAHKADFIKEVTDEPNTPR